jgi:hypothetical protein
MLDVRIRIAFTSSFSDIRSSHQVADKTNDPTNKWINDQSFCASVTYSRKKGGIPKMMASARPADAMTPSTTEM